MSTRRLLLTLVLLPVVLGGCAKPSNSQLLPLACAVVGGAAGAAVGSVADNNAGAVVGGGVGAVAGSLLCGGFNFEGREEDSDGDGVPDSQDRCPGTPPGVAVGPDGCPPDSDGDGVPDYRDECPDTPPGVAVGPNGCPNDSDGDGVPNDRDKCPGTPPGVAVDSDGCPDVTAPIDSDGDGAPDDRDRCPSTPAGSVADANGCPEVGERLIVLENINFDYDKAVIRADAEVIVDQALSILNDNPAMTVTIEGHTDSIASRGYNQALSERRARAVLDYLVSRGIEPGRLNPIGRGETSPITDNATEDGRAQNRRVEFIVTSK